MELAKATTQASNRDSPRAASPPTERTAPPEALFPSIVIKKEAKNYI
jgi:hypothetical protein